MAPVFGTDISRKHTMRMSSSCHSSWEAFLGETRWECIGGTSLLGSWQTDTSQSRSMVALTGVRTSLAFTQEKVVVK